MADLTPQEYAEQLKVVQTIALFVEMEFQLGPIHVWAPGVGKIEWRGVEWVGLGILAGVTPFSSASDGRATGHIFTLAGMPIMYGDMNLAQYVDEYTKRGGYCNAYLPHFDFVTGQIVPEPPQLLRGKMGAPVIELSQSTFRVSIAVETARARAQTRTGYRYTDETQRSFYPADRGFEYIAALQDKSLF